MDARAVLRGAVAMFPDSVAFPEVTMKDEEWYSRYSEGQSALRTRRIDGLVVCDSGERIAIEVKISESDFRREDWSKRAPWMSVTHRFYYAIPADMDRDYAPAGCGLIRVGEDGSAEIVEEADVTLVPSSLPHHVQMEMYRSSPLA